MSRTLFKCARALPSRVILIDKRLSDIGEDVITKNVYSCHGSIKRCAVGGEEDKMEKKPHTLLRPTIAINHRRTEVSFYTRSWWRTRDGYSRGTAHKRFLNYWMRYFGVWKIQWWFQVHRVRGWTFPIIFSDCRITYNKVFEINNNNNNIT